MTTMRAWRVHEFGEPGDVLVQEDVEPPTAESLDGLGMSMGGWVPVEQGGRAPYDDWVLLDMTAAALALPDVTMARGTYPVPVPHPYVSGQEGVGVVTDAGANTRHLLGKRVAACCIQPFGSLAPVAIGVGTIFEVPEVMSDEEGAAFVVPAHTAYHVVHRRGKVQPGETVVVLGAAGGIGTAYVQLCVALGARVVAVVGGPEKAAFCRDLGAETVDHTGLTDAEVVDAVRAVAGGGAGGSGVDVIIDPVQGQIGAALRAVLVPDGRHVLCGHAGGLVPHDPHFYVANHTLVGATLGGYPPEEMRRMYVETDVAVRALVDEGRYRPVVSEVVDFDEVPRVLTDMIERRTIGRVVVRVADPA